MTNGNEPQSYSTGPANTLLTDGIYNYEYDGEGNLVKRVNLASGETRTFVFDHRNRLVRVDDWSADPVDPENPAAGVAFTQSVKYSNDTLGRRVSRTQDVDGEGPAAPETEHFVNDRNNVWLDANEAGEVTGRYLFGEVVDQIIADLLAEGSRFHHSDIIGSSRMVVAVDGGVVGTQSYTAFGSPISIDLFGRYGFAGREIDSSTGLYYNRARSYEAIVGRFLSQDPIGFGAKDTMLYRYVSNGPTSATDPFGQYTILQYALAVSALAFAYSPVFVVACPAIENSAFNVVYYTVRLPYLTFGITVKLLEAATYLSIASALNDITDIVQECIVKE
ncbi:MAG: RHS repeat-associated core domain-containing protein [Pirellulaceae bacterium]